MDYYQYWTVNIHYFEEYRFNLKDEWKVILDCLDIKEFIKVTNKNLSKTIYINKPIEDIFSWTLNKNLKDIKAIIIVENLTSKKVKMIKEIDNSLDNKHILFIPLFYHKVEYNTNFYLNFVLKILNAIVTDKTLIVFSVKNPNFEFLTNPRRFKLKNCYIEGYDITNDYIDENKKIFEVINLYLTNKIIDINDEI